MCLHLKTLLKLNLRKFFVEQDAIELGRCRFFRSMSVSIIFRFFKKVDVDVGFGFLNNRNVGVDFDYLTNIAFQGKSVRLIVYNIHEVCKMLTAIATVVVNSLF